MSEPIKQMAENQAAGEVDTFMEALSEFATLRWNEALLKATGPDGCLWKKKKAIEEEYHKTYNEIKEKIGFKLTDRFATLKGELSSLEADHIYYQGLRDGARLYRMLTGK